MQLISLGNIYAWHTCRSVRSGPKKTRRTPKNARRAGRQDGALGIAIGLVSATQLAERGVASARIEPGTSRCKRTIGAPKNAKKAGRPDAALGIAIGPISATRSRRETRAGMVSARIEPRTSRCEKTRRMPKNAKKAGLPDAALGIAMGLISATQLAKRGVVSARIEPRTSRYKKTRHMPKNAKKAGLPDAALGIAIGPISAPQLKREMIAGCGRCQDRTQDLAI